MDGGCIGKPGGVGYLIPGLPILVDQCWAVPLCTNLADSQPGNVPMISSSPSRGHFSAFDDTSLGRQARCTLLIYAMQSGKQARPWSRRCRCFPVTWGYGVATVMPPRVMNHPCSPINTDLHWLVITMVLVLVLAGMSSARVNMTYLLNLNRPARILSKRA